MGRKNDSLPRGLSRVDHTASDVHLWRVQNPDGSFIYFGDSKHGSKEAALQAALIQLEATPIIGIRSSKFKTNTTGVIGVSPVRHKGRLVAYKAIAGSMRSKALYKFFYITEYPENIAFRLACLARAEFVGKLEEEELTRRNCLIRKFLIRLEEETQ